MPVSLTVEASLPEPRMVRNHTAWRCRPRTEAGFPPHGQSPRMGATSQAANGSSAPLTIRVRVSRPLFSPRPWNQPGGAGCWFRFGDVDLRRSSP